MFCPRCGAQVKDTAAFCCKCGAKVGARVAAISPTEPNPEEPSCLVSRPESPSPKYGTGNGMSGRGVIIRQVVLEEPADGAPAGGERPAPTPSKVNASSKVTKRDYLPIEIATICLAILVALCFFMPIVDLGWLGSYSLAGLTSNSAVKIVSSVLADGMVEVILLLFFMTICCAVASVFANRHPMINLATFIEGALIFLIFTVCLCVVGESSAADYIAIGFVMYWMSSLALAVCAGMSLSRRMKMR